MFHLLHGLGWYSSQCWVKEPQILKVMFPKQLKILTSKLKYKQSFTYTLAGTCNKAENFH